MPNPEQSSNTTASRAEPPILTIYRPTWSDHLLAIAFILYTLAFSALAITITYSLFS